MPSDGIAVSLAMAMKRRFHLAMVCFAMSVLPGACGKAGGGENTGHGFAGAADQEIGLVTSLPVYWPEVQDMGQLLSRKSASHWMLSALQARGKVSPIDDLAARDGGVPLPPQGVLVLAQPYPFSPEENVALDTWVRAGGRVLLFADPMLTFESSFALGDRRRPQDIALLSPILARWGLDLQFDQNQPAGERTAVLEGQAFPVNLSGSFALLPGNEGCRLDGNGLLADCRIGKGRVLVLADAALLEDATDKGADARVLLARLLDRLTS